MSAVTLPNAGPEADWPKEMGPKTGRTQTIALDNTGGSTDLSSLFTNWSGRSFVFYTNQACQIAFGDSAVTIGSTDPVIPAGVLIRMMPSGQFLGWKTVTSTGTLYIYPAS